MVEENFACIGIISWFPDNEKVRNVRYARLARLVKACNYNFNLPIIIVAQDWPEGLVEKMNKYDNVKVLKYGKLGITGARETLRQYWINETNYYYMIHFDDDFGMKKNKAVGESYINLLHAVKGKFIESLNFLMNFLALPRDIAEKEPFDLSIDPENGQGYEDWIYLSVLKQIYRDKYLQLNMMSITEQDRHTMTLDEYSTWKGNEKSDQTEISRNKIISEVLKRRGVANGKA